MWVLLPQGLVDEAGSAADMGRPTARRRRSSASRPQPRLVQVPITARIATIQALCFETLARADLPRFAVTYEIHVTETDQARLRLADRALSPLVSLRMLASLGVVVLQLVRRMFQDDPSAAAAAAGAGGTGLGGLARGGAGGRGDASDADSLGTAMGVGLGVGGTGAAAGGAASRRGTAGLGPGGMSSLVGPGLSGGASRTGASASAAGGAAGGGGGVGGVGSGFIHHTIVTASRYEEWQVVKVNRFGRRQERILGIDINRITNAKVPGQRPGWLNASSAATRVAERFMTDVLRVEVPTGRSEQEARQFSITYLEGMEPITVHYEAQSKEDRRDIINKLEYILGLNNDAHKIQYRAQ